MKWSNQRLPGLDDIFDRHHSPHAIAGATVGVVDHKAHLQVTTALSNSVATTSSMYVHIPFCPSRCLSCDHLTVVEHNRGSMDRYLDSVRNELMMMSAAADSALQIDRLHIGGGSPNYLDDIQLARLLSSIRAAFELTEDAHISMEINPRRTSRSQFDLLQGLGIKNLHLEVRDVDPIVQGELGRTQSFSLLEDVFSVARDMEFDSVNMDLLFGLPGQTSRSMKSSVAMIAELGPDTLVCQQYTRRPQQFPHQAALDDLAMPSLAEKLSIFNAIVMGFEDQGYEWIGLNAFVRPEHPLVKAQNANTLEYTALGYSEVPTAQTLGIGVGAVSEVGDLVSQNYIDLDAWMTAIEKGQLATQYLIEATDFEIARKSVMRRLMCNIDVPVAAVDQPEVAELLASLESQGYTEQRGTSVHLTSLGRLALPQFWSDSSPRYRWL